MQPSDARLGCRAIASYRVGVWGREYAKNPSDRVGFRGREDSQMTGSAYQAMDVLRFVR